jgi:lipoprotein NlpD
MKRQQRTLANYRLVMPAALAVFALILAGCASNPPAPVEDLSIGANVTHAARETSSRQSNSGSYRVLRGDTLYAIAFKHGLDYRDLAAWNRIVSPYRIYAGQELRLSASAMASKPAIPVSDHAPDHAPTAVAPDRVVATTAGVPPATPQNLHVDNATPPPQAPAPAVGFQPVETATPAEVQPQAVAATLPAPVDVPPKAAPAAAVPPSVAPAKPNESVAELNAGGVSWRWPGDGKIIGTYVSGDQTKQGVDIAGKAGDPVQAAADGEVVYSGNGLLGYGELIIVKHNASFLSAYGHNRKRLVQEGDRVKAGQRIAEMGSSASARDELHFEIRKNGKPVNPLDYLPVR